MKRLLAYPHQEFRNFLVSEELKHWKKNTDQKELSEALIEKYKAPVQSVNFFIRLALGLFTIILATVGTSLLGMLFFEGYNSESSIPPFAIFQGAVFIGILELYINRKKNYRSGIDDVLLYGAYGAFLVAYCYIFYSYENSGPGFIISVLIFSGIISGIGAVRYNDMLAALTSWASFIGALLVAFYSMGSIGTALMPFTAALTGGASYYVFRKLRNEGRYILWDSCLWLLEITSLLLLYSALNYFIVRTLTEELLDVYLEEGQDIQLAWLFYFTTATIPFVYMYLGIKQRNRILFRTGLVLIAIAALTFKYYFSTGHHEITLTASGALLIIICAALHKWLKEDKAGLTLKEDPSEEPFKYVDAESLIIVQSFGHGQGSGTTDTTGTELGGGNFGGGGSSDSF